MKKTILVLALLATGACGGVKDDAPKPEVKRESVIPSTPCPTEDSPGPCFWDASERGNGTGRDFWIDANQNSYIPFRNVEGHRDCWIHFGNTSRVVCEDGYRTTS